MRSDDAMDIRSILMPVIDASIPTFSLRESLLLVGSLQDGHGEPQSHMPVSVVRFRVLVSLRVH